MMMREATSKNGVNTCHKSYLTNTLAQKEIGTIGKVFNIDWGTQCFSGAFVDGLGMDTPVRLVVSQVELSDTESIIGLLVHEILHALGVGHTQKRPDRDTYITDYDCSSIMHYGDTDFTNHNGKTMTAKDANKCKFAYNTKLTTSDITLLKKMYCDNSKKNLVTSPNYPKNYPESKQRIPH